MLLDFLSCCLIVAKCYLIVFVICNSPIDNRAEDIYVFINLSCFLSFEMSGYIFDLIDGFFLFLINFKAILIYYRY